MCYGEVVLMRIKMSPTVNGATFDFAALQDGAVLPRDAVECEYLVSDVIRTGGQIDLTGLMP